MFRTNRVIFACALVVILILVGSSSRNVVVNPAESTAETKTSTHRRIPSNSYITHGPININSNADFTSQGWPGNGTIGNPYVIEGLFINVGSPGISISDTTVYFAVKSCYITLGTPSIHEGISFDSVANGVVSNCTIDMYGTGINLVDSFNCNLTHNVASSNRYTGFNLDNSNNCTLINNTVFGDAWGIILHWSDSCTIENNSVYDNSNGGIALLISIRCTITNNNLNSNGFVISGGNISNWFHDMSGNTVDNKPLGYFLNLNNSIIDCSEFGQVILVNCTMVIAMNGYFSNTSDGMQLGFCTYCTLKQNTVSDNTREGIILQYSDNCTLIDNIVSNNNFGIYLFDSDNCVLINNDASRNEHGILLENSDRCTLANNIMTNNSIYGTQLWNVDNCILINNSAFDNSDFGFFLYSSIFCTLENNTSSDNSYLGFYIAMSANCTLTNNTASRNFLDGIRLSDSDSCTLTNNTATNNQRYGFVLDDDCAQNTIYLNRLGDNGVTNAKDDGIDNAWDDGVSLGNYWMDYSGEGTYLIPGDAGSVDNYPFVWKPVPPTDDIALILVIVGTVFVSILGVIVIIFVYKKKHA